MPELVDIGNFKEFRKHDRALAEIVKASGNSDERAVWVPRAALRHIDPQVAIMAIDPGETTGWSIMALSAEALVEPDVPILGAPEDGGINFWAHGQVDCGAHTGNAGMSGTRGMSAETGQLRDIPVAAGVLARSSVGKGRAGRSVAKLRAIAATERTGGRKRDARAANATGLSGGSVDLGVSTTGEASGVSELMGIYAWACTEWGVGNLCVLIEDFIPRKPDKSRKFLSPVRITAQVDYALWLRGAGSWRQSPADAKSVVTDARLEAWGFYIPRVSEAVGSGQITYTGNSGWRELRPVTGGKGAGKPHARDADRHAIAWLRRCKGGAVRKSALLRAECWPEAYRR